MISEVLKQALHNKGYQYLKTLGSGGFGRVFLVKEIISNNFFAVKHLKDAGKDRQVHILREIIALGNLNHPNIISYKTSFRIDDSLFLVMEHCYHGSLNSFLLNKKPALEFIVNIFTKLTKVFEFLHSKGIIHHDIKPANILVTEDENIKISDFGSVNTSIGTIIYSAPEMLNNNPPITDPRIDVYALGLTLLECIIGEHPFRLDSKITILNKLQNADLPVNDMELWLQQIILKACHFNPESRFQNMLEFHMALINRNIPKIISADIVDHEKFAQKLETFVKLKKWNAAKKLLSMPNAPLSNLNFQIHKGNYFLATHQIESAKQSFEAAQKINISAPVEKALAEIYLQKKEIAKATALLQGYINKRFFDPEAHNQLLHAYYISGKWELGMEQAAFTLSLFPNNDIFLSNFYLFGLLTAKLDSIKGITTGATDFIKYNYEVFKNNEPICWLNGESPFLGDKLLFHEYRFKNISQSVNTVLIYYKDMEYEAQEHIISFGREGYDQNHYAIFSGTTVSRRHFVIVNQNSNVWLYDLNSNYGVFVDGKRVIKKQFLNGLHTIRFGNHEIKLKTSNKILL